MKFTVLGASGFIGSSLCAKLSAEGHEVLAPGRDDGAVFSRDLGHVFYCIGLTADFRARPLDTVRAHVCLLADILERARFESLLYLSSTRVYGNSATGDESTLVVANAADPNDLYNLSKLMGESLSLHAGRENVRVARLSNVYGGDLASDNFLSAVIREAVDTGSVTLRTSPDSAKDYISIVDVVELLPKIALCGRSRLYNVASGTRVENRAILARLSEISGCRGDVAPDAPTIRFPIIDISRLREEFGFRASSLLEDLPSLIEQYRAKKT